jgi:ubiquinone/menaquinone biosynthesis C-methylase UbiE
MSSIAQWRDVWRRFSGRGTYPHELAFVLNIPLRRFIFSPAQLIERLHLTPAARVLEIGPGPGYFSPHVARALPRGTLILFDLQVEMLAKARARLARAGATNVGFVQGDATRLPFQRACFDVVFLVAVLGEVSRPDACVAGVHHVLRPGGLLAVTELPGDPDAVPREAVVAIAHAHGFEVAESVPARRGFTLTFRNAS